MIRFRSRTPRLVATVPLLAAGCLLASGFAQTGTCLSLQEVRITDLPVRVARSHDPADVLRAVLSTMVHD